MKHSLLLMAFIAISSITLSQTAEKPNILFIVFDDMNDWVEGFDGHPQTITPNIFEIEQEGVTFLSAYCPSPICAPSRTTLLSGKDCAYTKIDRLDEYNEFFRENFTAANGNEFIVTLPEHFRENGYYTYTIGKIFHGAERDGDYDKTNNSNPCIKENSWNKKLYVKDAGSIKDIPNECAPSFKVASIADSLEPLLQDTRSADSAAAFLKRFSLGTQNTCGEPFFLALGIKMPHIDILIPDHYFLDYYNNDYYAQPFEYPYNRPVDTFPYNGVVMPPQPDTLWGDYYNLGPVAQNIARQHKVHQNVLNKAESLIENFGVVVDSALSDSERIILLEETLRGNSVLGYLAAIRFADYHVGRVLDSLRMFPDVYNNTIIVLVSDHGFSLGEKTHWLKSALWETDIRVPLVIKDPRKPGGLVCNKPVGLVDIFPTLCDMVEIEYPTFPDSSRYLDGESFATLIENPQANWEKPALTTIRSFFDEQGSCYPNYSVRSDRFHYIRWRSNGDGEDLTCNDSLSYFEEELYEVGINREVDPNEWNNLINDPDYKIVKEYLQQFIPDSALYLQQPYSITIIPEDNTCYHRSTEQIPFSVNLLNPEGNILDTLPEGLQVIWWTSLDENEMTGLSTSLSIPADTAAGVNEQDFIIYVALYDTTHTVMYAYDMIPYTVYDDKTKYPSFKSKTIDKRVFLKNVDFPENTKSAKITYGDGHIQYLTNIISSDLYQYRHLYADYGTYTVVITAQLDIDSNICTVSDSIIINLGEFIHVELRLNPNPVKDEIFVSVSGPQNSYVASVYNSAGIKMSEQQVAAPNETDNLQFNTSSFMPGCYFVKITGEDVNETQSFIKIE
ncbi:MAG: sulfatase-like hydrolase/transferase [Fimbriimonadaceae bacterium]|nr:sulfatase-like hydrolase/transferase [Chitinophagales bacterium]